MLKDKLQLQLHIKKQAQTEQVVLPKVYRWEEKIGPLLTLAGKHNNLCQRATIICISCLGSSHSQTKKKEESSAKSFFLDVLRGKPELKAIIISQELWKRNSGVVLLNAANKEEQNNVRG